MPNLQVILQLTLFVCFASGKLVIVDLTHEIAENATAFWGMEDVFEFSTKTRETLPNYLYQANVFKTAEHGGTHIDAPIHFADGKQTLEEIPLERLIGKPYIIDVADECNKNPDYQLDIEKIEEVENQQGPIPDGSIVLVYTGENLKDIPLSLLNDFINSLSLLCCSFSIDFLFCKIRIIIFKPEYNCIILSNQSYF